MRPACDTATRRRQAGPHSVKENDSGQRPEPLCNRVRRTRRSAKLGVDAGELRVQRAADAVDDGDDGNRDAGGDEAILDGGRTGLILHEPRNQGLHGVALLESMVRERFVQRSWVLMLENFVFNVVPMPLTTAMITTEMPAAMRPYSMAVAPASCFSNRETSVFI